MLRHCPNLRGYLACDASGPIGIARAVVSAGRAGTVTVVGMDSIAPIAAAVADGVLSRPWPPSRACRGYGRADAVAGQPRSADPAVR